MQAPSRDFDSDTLGPRTVDQLAEAEAEVAELSAAFHDATVASLSLQRSLDKALRDNTTLQKQVEELRRILLLGAVDVAGAASFAGPASLHAPSTSSWAVQCALSACLRALALCVTIGLSVGVCSALGGGEGGVGLMDFLRACMGKLGMQLPAQFLSLSPAVLPSPLLSHMSLCCSSVACTLYLASTRPSAGLGTRVGKGRVGGSCTRACHGCLTLLLRMCEVTVAVCITYALTAPSQAGTRGALPPSLSSASLAPLTTTPSLLLLPLHAVTLGALITSRISARLIPALTGQNTTLTAGALRGLPLASLHTLATALCLLHAGHTLMRLNGAPHHLPPLLPRALVLALLLHTLAVMYTSLSWAWRSSALYAARRAELIHVLALTSKEGGGGPGGPVPGDAAAAVLSRLYALHTSASAQLSALLSVPIAALCMVAWQEGKGGEGGWLLMLTAARLAVDLQAG